MLLTKKTGFLVIKGPVIVIDERGVLVYDSSFPKKPVKRFNLPRGNYTISSGIVSKLKRPVFYKLHALPPKQRTYPSPRSFKVVFGNNKNKCSVVWNKKIIIFDNSFRKAPRFIIDFILFHEFGHQFYNTELYADLWAGNAMKKVGYNPSQIGIAPLLSLSNFQKERKNKFVNKIIASL